MTIKEIANRLVEINRNSSEEKAYLRAYQELYAPDAVSVEHWSGTPQKYQGIEAIHEKAQQWEENLVEMHDMQTSDALVADHSFAVTFSIDATFKDMGRQKTIELAVYHVKDGKIVHEEFYG